MVHLNTPLVEVEATFRHEYQRWGDTVLARVNCLDTRAPVTGDLTFKGDVPLPSPEDADSTPALVPGLNYRWYGRWVEHHKYGRQFHFTTFTVAKQHDKRGVVAYLKQAPGIGQVAAETLWSKFAGDAVRVLRETPDVAAAAVDRLTLENAQRAAAKLCDLQATEDVSVDLLNLLAGRKMPRALSQKLIRRFGANAAEIVERNPFILKAFYRVGFIGCDQLYLDLGKDPARLKRQAYAAEHELETDNSGSTWMHVDKVLAGVYRKVGSASVRPKEALTLAKRGRLIDTYHDDEHRIWIALRSRADDERRIARKLDDLIERGYHRWPSCDDDTSLSEHQRGQLAAATSGRVGVLAGSPGTGKSYTAAVLITQLLAGTGGQVAIAAPTGKAAVRVNEAMAGYGIELQATTIHRLLGVAEADNEDGGSGFRFRHGPMNPLPHRYVVVDESSMIDTTLFANLVDALHPSAHLLLIGDPYQLPPVGHGAPLRDLIAAGLPCGELTEIRRNAGRIVQCCAAMRDESKFEPSDSDVYAYGVNDENLWLMEPSQFGAGSPINAMHYALGFAIENEMDPFDDIQVVVPLNDNSPLSRRRLNMMLQSQLNPGGETEGGTPFRARDKIICLKNGFYKASDGTDAESLDDDGRVFVANGEQGRVLQASRTSTLVRLKSPNRVVSIPRSTGSVTAPGCDWDLAYAITVHKSQGSEWPVVIVMLDDAPGARMVCSRNWLFTAISRARVFCHCVGKLHTAQAMTRRDATNERKTFLAELVRGSGITGSQRVEQHSPANQTAEVA